MKNENQIKIFVPRSNLDEFSNDTSLLMNPSLVFSEVCLFASEVLHEIPSLILAYNVVNVCYINCNNVQEPQFHQKIVV